MHADYNIEIFIPIFTCIILVWCVTQTKYDPDKSETEGHFDTVFFL